MKTILLIATGGTIASKIMQDGLTPKLTSTEILDYIPEIRNLCVVDTIQLFNLDSTNILYTHWCEMVRCIKDNYKSYDGFVITHGTDTMAYTAAALSYLIQDSSKPIVITGSQKSISMSETDARINLKDAFKFAVDDYSCGVHLVFDGKVIIGTRARKIRTKSYHAFSSVDYPETAVIRDEKLIYFFKEKKDGMVPKFYSHVDPKVFVLKLIPGIQADIFPYLKDRYNALIIESFGVGGIPSYEEDGFMNAITDWIQSGRIVVITTQVPHEGMNMDIYEVGYKLKKQFEILEAFDMTLEAVVTKLMWILGQTKDPKTIRNMFYKPIQNDIICTIEERTK